MSPHPLCEARIDDHRRPDEASDAVATNVLPQSESIANQKATAGDSAPAIFVLDPALFNVENALQLRDEQDAAVKTTDVGDQAQAIVLDESPSSTPSQLADDLSRLCLSPESTTRFEVGHRNTQTDEESCPAVPPGLSTGETTTTTTGTHHVPILNQIDIAESDALQVDPDIAQAGGEDLGLYSVASLSPLDAYIPDNRLPEELLVHDLHNITGRCPDPRTPVRYVRAKPGTEGSNQFAASAGAEQRVLPRVAHLYLAEDNRLGEGHHSMVFRAPFTVHLDSASDTASRVTVAVKTTSAECGAHYMLHQEAAMYTSFPRSLMDENCLQSTASALEAAVDNNAARSELPAGEDAPVEQVQLITGKTKEMEIRVLPPIVPKFYGYYLPVDDDGNLVCRTHIKCKEDGTCDVDWPTRLLLVEECGVPVDPWDFAYDQRLECFSLFRRLHEAGFVQYSPYRRNMLVQPGPLSAPRRERSFAAPSFRIIDFGRGENKRIEREVGDARRFSRWVAHDEKWAKSSLNLL